MNASGVELARLLPLGYTVALGTIVFGPDLAVDTPHGYAQVLDAAMEGTLRNVVPLLKPSERGEDGAHGARDGVPNGAADVLFDHLTHDRHREQPEAAL